MSDPLIISDINGICRLCLTENGTIIPIFGRENTSRDCIPLPKKILDCVSVNVTQEDGLPNKICVSCVHQVDSWHGFKNTCDSSQKKLSSWLQQTNPELFKKSEAERRWENKRSTHRASTQQAIIDVSSDDDEVVVTHQPAMRPVFNRRRQHSRLSGQHQNIELMSINTNEIEILPIDNAEHINRVEGSLNGDTISDLPDVVTGLDTSVTLFPARCSDHHILPDSESSEHPQGDSTTTDVTTKQLTGAPCDDHLNDDVNSENIEPVQIDNGDLPMETERDVSELQDNVTAAERTTEPLENDHNSPVEQECSEWSTKSRAEEISSKENDHAVEVRDTNTASSENSTNRITAEKTDDVDKSTEGTSSDPTEDNSSTFVIEEITSLSNHERMDEEVNSQEQEDNADTKSTSSRSSQDEDSRDVQPDIVLCETSMIMNIKEEPLSACEEGSGDEEDPLNFQSVTMKRESLEWENECEDVKPNVRLLNEAMMGNYTPKRLKCGKLHCEPCRVSFINDVYYERHATSLRHKLNYKLMRSGRAPTKKRGKSLIQAIMGNNLEPPVIKKNGPFFCNQCPSAFKHARNLTTHLKKHRMQSQFSETNEHSLAGSHEESTMQEDPETTSKPPMRLSALNARFMNQAETSCDLCDQSFSTVPALLSHKRYCGVSENRICKLCHRSFTTLSLFFKHRKQCTKLYRSQTYGVKHQQVNAFSSTGPSQVPNDGSVLACTLCNLTFESSPDLIEHMQSNHMDFGKPKHSAELPDFAKPNNFNRTNDSSLHYCKYCLRSFSTHSALTSHTGYHARKSVYCCKFCRLSYRDKLTFRQHMKTHISNPNLNRNVCWICYTPFSSHKDLIDHKNIHANIKMKIFSCDSCENSYNTRELLARHKRAAHDSGQPMTTFGDHFLKDEGVTETKHFKIIDEDNKLFSCRICKKKFSTIGNVKRHSLIHKRTQNLGNLSSMNVDHTYLNRCSWCQKTFKTQSGLLNHRSLCNRVKTTALPNANNMIIGNSLNKPLKCKGCKKWFASKNSLYKHKVMKRCRITPVTPVVQLRHQNCPNCDQQFLSEESLNRHKQLCKPTIERLTCDCGEVFPSVDQKLTHAESCQANCTCKFCNMKFNSPEEMESHKSICQIQSRHSPSPQPSFKTESRAPPLECHKCNKKFIYNKCLNMHIDKCLYDRWPCTHCKEIFASETALATHKSHKTCQSQRYISKSLPVSIDENPTFKCEYCPQRFASGNELKEHMFICDSRPPMRQKNVDTVYRPFTCDLCDKSFLWKANLWRHKKIIHKIVVQSKTSQSESSVELSEKTAQNNQKESYKCNICPDIIFHKKQGFLEHQMAHEREKGNHDLEQSADGLGGILLTCELCDKKVPETLYPVHMDEHMNDDFEGSSEQVQNNSTSGEKYPCDICGKEFDTPASRKSHRAAHYRRGDIMAHQMSPKSKNKRKIKVKHVRCHTCHKMLSINSIHKHRMMHKREEAEFYGDNRNSAPVKSSSINNTSRSVTPTVMSDIPEVNEDDDTSTVFPCPKCDGSFKLRRSLLEHLKSHAEDSMETESTSSATGPADQYQYKCVYCDLSWKYKSVYERHLASKKHLEIQKQLSGII